MRITKNTIVVNVKEDISITYGVSVFKNSIFPTKILDNFGKGYKTKTKALEAAKNSFNIEQFEYFQIGTREQFNAHKMFASQFEWIPTKYIIAKHLDCIHSGFALYEDLDGNDKGAPITNNENIILNTQFQQIWPLNSEKQR